MCVKSLRALCHADDNFQKCWNQSNWPLCLFIYIRGSESCNIYANDDMVSRKISSWICGINIRRANGNYGDIQAKWKLYTSRWYCFDGTLHNVSMTVKKVLTTKFIEAIFWNDKYLFGLDRILLLLAVMNWKQNKTK